MSSASSPEIDAGDAPAARSVERELQVVDALLDAGMEIVQAVRAQAGAAGGAEDPAAALAQAALAYERAARALRLTVVLRSALVNDPEGVGLSAAARAERARRGAANDDDARELVVRWVDPDWMTPKTPAAPRPDRPETLDVGDADLERPLADSAARVRQDLDRAARWFDGPESAEAGAAAPDAVQAGPAPPDPPPFQPQPQPQPQPPPPPRRDFIDALCNSS